MHRKYTLLLIIFTLHFYSAKSQNNLEEQLLNKVNKYSYTNTDSSFFYHKKLESFYKKSNDLESLFWIKINLISTSMFLQNRELYRSELDSSRLFLNSNINELKQKGHYPLMYVYQEYYEGSYYYSVNDTQAATRIFTSLNNYLLDDNVLDDVIRNEMFIKSNNFLAKIYSQEKKFDLAEQHYLNNRLIIKNKFNNNLDELYINNYLLADVYSQQNEFKKSNNLLIPTLNYNINNFSNNNRIISIADYISNNYISLNQLDSATYYLAIQKKYMINEKDPFWENYYTTNATIFIEKEIYDSAEIELTKSLQFSKLKWGEYNPRVAESYNMLGELKLKTKEYQKAKEYFNSGIAQVENSEYSNAVNSRISLLKSYLNLFKINEVDAQINSSIINTCNQLIQSIRQSNENEIDKQTFLEFSFPFYNQSVIYYTEKNKRTKQHQYIDSTFNVFEKSKSNILLDALFQSKASSFSGISDEMILKERQLKVKITTLENDLNDLEIINKSEKQSELFKTKESYRNHIKTLEKNYSKYYDLKYKTTVTTLKEMQDKLNHSQLFVSYYAGENTLFCIAISTKRKELYEIPYNKELEKRIKEYSNQIKNPQSSLKEISKNSQNLYNLVLKPITTNFKEKTIIISPDGILNYVPFESLIQENGSYLIEDYNVSYINSATLLFELETKKQKNSLMAFAPNFEGENTLNLSYLPNNENEVESILTSFSGSNFLNGAATKQKFIEESSSSSIYHFATHAIYDDQFPDRSFLAFSSNKTSDNQLFVNEIYNLDMSNSNMVTLSACETGIGDLKKGEGFISLARAFFYSGAKSITSTLWQINDASSTNIMSDYYEQLADGKSKSKALQLAKLNYLEMNKGTKLIHPYYWSAFIVSGNNEPLKNSFNWWWVALITFIPVAYLLYKKGFSTA